MNGRDRLQIVIDGVNVVDDRLIAAEEELRKLKKLQVEVDAKMDAIVGDDQWKSGRARQEEADKETEVGAELVYCKNGRYWDPPSDYLRELLGKKYRCRFVVRTETKHPVEPERIEGDYSVLNKDNTCEHFESSTDDESDAEEEKQKKEETRKSRILGEDWRYDDGSGGYVGKGIYRVDDDVVDPDNWEREIAALPDALRALKMVRAKTAAGDGNMRVIKLCGTDDRKIDAVFKKAGVE